MTAFQIPSKSRTKSAKSHLHDDRRKPETLKQNWHFYLLTVWLLTVFLLGGSARADVAALQLLRPMSVIVLAAGLWGLTETNLRANRWLLGGAAACLALPLLQIIPLPPAIWHALPGRDLIREIDRSVGLEEIWRPLSMAPDATRNAFWALLAPVSVIVLGVQLDDRDKVRLLPLVIALGCLSAAVGMVQIVGARDGPLYFYQFSHNGQPIGLFANRNHQAVLLATMLPMLATWTLQRRSGKSYQSWRRTLPLIAGLPAIFLLLLLTQSRSGMIIGLLALAVATAFLWASRRPDDPSARQSASLDPRWIAILSLIGLAALVAMALALHRSSSIERLAALSFSDDARVRILPVVTEMTGTYLPWGTGLGAFEQAFLIREPDTLLSPFYMNHAHNDWLELVLTGGLPALMLLAWGFAGFVRQLPAIWRSGATHAALARLGAATVLLLALASLTDYPLRTPSLACLGAVAALWMTTVPPRSRIRQND